MDMVGGGWIQNDLLVLTDISGNEEMTKLMLVMDRYVCIHEKGIFSYLLA